MDTQPDLMKNIVDKFTNTDKNLFLSQTYNGFLFTQPVNFKSSDSETMKLSANHKVFYLCHNRDAVLHEESFQSKVIGRVSSFNLQTGELIFDNVELRKEPWFNRCESRIQPYTPLVGILHTRSENFRGCINSLSLHGAGFLLHVSEINMKLPKPGQIVALYFKLPGDIEMLIRGKITNIKSLSHQLFSVGIKLTTNEKQLGFLDSYLRDSYRIMLRQIDEDYRRVLEPGVTTDLYF